MAVATPSPDRVDPAWAWQPWAPTAADPWNGKWAGHLYRRAAFGATPAELRAAVARGLPATLDLLVKGEPRAGEWHDDLMQTGAVVAGRNDVGELRAWWLYCIFNSGHPLREKLTLFWHNHFATSIGKVKQARLMFAQNKLLRERALGKFEPLVQAVSKDPAMLVWLDSNSNVKAAPNENYARELMELFTLGVGNYTERDVREAARAFTGWHTDDDGYVFNPRAHDDGPKTVLGQTGRFNGNDVVRILVKRPACAKFVVRKLYSFLISEAHDPTDRLLEPLCDRFRRSDGDITDLVKTMLGSKLFFSDVAFRQRIKWPVEYVVGAVRVTVTGNVPPQPLVQPLEAMGQELFAPPNVKGWRCGKAWLNASTMLARQNFGQRLAMGTLWTGARFGPRSLTPAQAARLAAEEEARRAEEEARLAAEAKFGKKGKVKPRPPAFPEEPAPPTGRDPARLVREAKAAAPADAVRVLLDAYLPGGVRPDARDRLVAYVADGGPKGTALERRAREATQAILAMPESQMA
jgi:hypothetical protein